jgi:hypothetical protein
LVAESETLAWKEEEEYPKLTPEQIEERKAAIDWYRNQDGKSNSMHEWIDVNDRLPEEGGRYWCYVEHLTDLGFSYFQWNCDYNPQLRRFSDMTLTKGERITHWRNLPEPPKLNSK